MLSLPTRVAAKYWEWLRSKRFVIAFLTLSAELAEDSRMLATRAWKEPSGPDQVFGRTIDPNN